MSSKSWLFTQDNPGSNTCFLLGRISLEEDLFQFSKYKDVVWFIDQDYVQSRYHLYENLHISTLESIDQEKLEEIVQLLIQVNPSVLPDIFCSRGILDNHPAAYDLILQRIQINCEETLRARQTRQEEGYLAQKNIIENLPFYISNRISEDSFGKLQNIPVAIVGAGPSLDVSIGILKEHHEKFLVFAVDSTLSILHEYGIKPNATFSIDAEKPASACLPKGQSPGALFLTIKSPNDWCHTNYDQLHFLSGNNLTEDWLKEKGIKKTTLSALGNCGITAVKTAIHLGCSPILLFGMDHATSDSGDGHAKNVNQDISRGKTHNPASRNTTVPGNYSEKVRTFLLNEWEKLNQLIKQLPEAMEIWNVTDRGAKFDNTLLVHPETFKLDTNVLTDKPRIHCNHISNSLELQKVKEVINDLLINQQVNIDKIHTTIDANSSQLLLALTQLFQHASLSKLIGSFSFKTIPNLLIWDKLQIEQKQEIRKETISLIKLLTSINPKAKQ